MGDVERDVKQTPFDLLKAASSAVSDRQLALSEAKLMLDESEKAARRNVNGIVECVRNLADRIKRLMDHQIEQMVSRRRSELEDMSSSLACAPPQLLQAYSAYENDNGKDRELNFQQKLQKILSGVNGVFSGENWEKEFVYVMNVVPSSEFAPFLYPNLPLNSFLRLENILPPRLVSFRVLKVDSAAGSIACEVKVDLQHLQPEAYAAMTNRCKNFFPHILLVEMGVEFMSAGNKNDVLMRNTFKGLKKSGKLEVVDGATVRFECRFDPQRWQGRDVIIVTTMSGCPVKNSPFLVYITMPSKESVEPNREQHQEIQSNPANKWTPVDPSATNQGGLNLTRTGERPPDLDQSDARAMGYNISMTAATANGAADGTTVAADATTRLSIVHEESSKEMSSGTCSSSDDQNSKKVVESETKDANKEEVAPPKVKFHDILKSAVNASDPPPAPPGSPAVMASGLALSAANLPLNQPSPVSATVVHRAMHQAAAMEDGGGVAGVGGTVASPQFTPSVASTSSNLSAKLESLQIHVPKMDSVEDKPEGAEENDQDKEGSDHILDSGHPVDLSTLQENLSRKAQEVAANERSIRSTLASLSVANAPRANDANAASASDAAKDANAANATSVSQHNGIRAKNVSFNPETTVLEQVSVGSSVKTNEEDNDPNATAPYQLGAIDFHQQAKAAQAGVARGATYGVSSSHNNGGASGGKQWKLSKGTTKTSDGELALCKSLLKLQQMNNEQDEGNASMGNTSVGSSNASALSASLVSSCVTDWSSVASMGKNSSVWSYSVDDWNSYLEERRYAPNGRVVRLDDDSDPKVAAEAKLAAETAKNKTGNDTTLWLEEDREGFKWNDKPKGPPPEFDLTRPDLSFVPIKTFQLGFGGIGDESQLPMTSSSPMPQSVARDSVRNVTYVTDIKNNQLHKFEGWEYKGVWTPDETFLFPRYALCIPDVKHDNRHGMNVVVLDQVALYVFKASGSLKAKTFVGEAKKYRGLAYHKGHGRLVTTEKVEGRGTYVVFIETQTFKVVAKRILLTPTATTEYFTQNTKCRFLTCHKNKVITTDMGLGCYYVTDLTDDVTVSYSHSVAAQGSAATAGSTVNILKGATDVLVDPAGNVVVATCGETGKEAAAASATSNEGQHHEGKLQLFTPNGAYVKALKGLENLEKPAGLCLEGKVLYAVDVRRAVVELYTLKGATSPTKSSPTKKSVKRRTSFEPVPLHMV